MQIPRAVAAVVYAPKRFLDWLYAPMPRRGPTRAEAITHLRVAASGLETDRWMAIEAEERRQHNASIEQDRSS
jgi:hypothetical protein